jgi:hypothetical protein
MPKHLIPSNGAVHRRLLALAVLSGALLVA